MTTASVSNTEAGNYSPICKTNALSGDATASVDEFRKVQSNKWRRLIDDYLIEWGKNPKTLKDEDIEPPSREVINVACNFSKIASEHDWVAPDRVMPNCEGGIIFELKRAGFYRTIEISDDALCEISVYQDHELKHRRHFSLDDLLP